MSKLVNLNGQPTLQSHKVPAGQLYNYHIEIENGKHTVWNLLLKKQIKAFYDQNGRQLEVILREVRNIQKEYLVFDGDKVKMENEKPVLIEGKTEEEMNKDWSELMNREAYIVI